MLVILLSLTLHVVYQIISMKSYLFYILILTILCFSCKEISSETNSLETVFEKSNGKETATYEETISYYKTLAKRFKNINIDTYGETDSGLPLHLVTLNSMGNFNFDEIRKTQRIILINNGIHPGESDGIDATMMLYRDLANGSIHMPKNTVIATIPIYNIGGSLNRNSTTRNNQNGPVSYGFRGNARNYDLNRDFIKADTKNARSFFEIFHQVKPEVFIDNHVSNGADYQYTLTHLFTQHNKLGGPLGKFTHDSIMPTLELKLRDKQWDITPYVNVFNRTPESGFSQFLDHPRYSTGYTTLFNTIGMMVETHMLKPYDERVKGTYELMKSMLEITDQYSEQIEELRVAQAEDILTRKSLPLDWEIDTTKYSTIAFKGYEGNYIKSTLTNAERLKYDRSKPFEKSVTYNNHFKAKLEVEVPEAYIIPQQWSNIIELLKLNNVDFQTIKTDTVITVESYKIDNYDTRRSPYEGHYQHYNTTVKATIEEVSFRKGDVLVYTNQAGKRYIVETLEPQAPDSFFNWNFFDTILQQKEGFSPYVWEDKAALLLKQNPQLQINFNIKKSYDPDFANNWFAQLDWLHKQSPYYEKAHLQYPIYRLK